MDGNRFDVLVRSWGTRSRRGLLGLLAGGLAALEAGGGGAAAGCAKAGKRCGHGKRCCEGARCKHGRCRCTSSFTTCGGRCVDVETDPNNCGACGNTCAAEQACEDNHCCLPPQAACESVLECCLARATDCAPIATNKGGLAGCGFFGNLNRCCIRPPAFDRCESDCDCCGDALCRNNACCGQAGARCFSPSDCCSGRCNLAQDVCE